jgi:hypothetical protein
MKFGMNIDHKHNYKCYINKFLVLKFWNIEMKRSFGVMFDTFLLEPIYREADHYVASLLIYAIHI